MTRLSKYRAIPEVVDGIRFASKAEARRYRDLKLMERAGEIANLETQPVFPLNLLGVKLGKYIADFRYTDLNRRGPQGQKGCVVVEDVKSPATRTPVFKLKLKLMAALYPGVEVTEIGATTRSPR